MKCFWTDCLCERKHGADAKGKGWSWGRKREPRETAKGKPGLMMTVEERAKGRVAECRIGPNPIQEKLNFEQNAKKLRKEIAEKQDLRDAPNEKS